MPDTDQERTEEPTSKRRQDYREKGQVAQSKEVGTAALMTAMVVLWFFYAPVFWENLSVFVAGFLSIAGQYEVSQSSLPHLLGFVLQRMFNLLAPFMLVVVVVGFFASFLQIGWLFTAKPMIPELAKFDPIKGFAKFFSKKSLVEVIKSLAKVALVGYVAFSTVRNEFEGALYLVDMDVSEAINYLARVALLILVKCCGIFIVLAFLDFTFQRYEMNEQMKMTKQEVKEEFKDTEGDPQVKGRIRSIQIQMARRRMMAEVPKADVIITNPTHISVAVLYEKGGMDAPQIIAKGADKLALRIREIAKENNIPMVENVFVARALHKLDIGVTIPENLFKAVAEILAYVYKLKGKKP